MRIEDLSIEEKKALLVRALKRQGQHKTFAPVSQAQKRLWFLEQLAPGSAIYNVGKAVRILGRINIPTVERVLNEIIRRHETLRTTFRLEGDDPVQVISKPSPFNLSIQHIADSTAGEVGQQITASIISEIQRPFNLSTGPLLRIALFRVSEEDHVAVVAMHHIISDGWSTGIFIKELGLLYAAYSHGMPSPLPEPAIQYKDLALRERQNSTAGRLDELICFWQQHLKDAPHIISLPTDRPRNNVMAFAGRKKSFAIPIELARSLKELAASTGVTLYMALLAIFSALLHRLTKEDEFLVGTPVAGRDRPETQELIGFLVNTVVLRMNLVHNPTFLDFCARVREEALSCFEHQDLPFDKLVETIRPERNLGMNPLIQVMIALHNMPLPSPSYPGISITPLDVHSGISPLDLAIEFYDGPSGITGGIEYKTSLFDDSTIERMASQFLGLAASVVARPDARLSEHSLLTESEHHKILVEWNETAKTFPGAQCIHHLFEAQAQQQRDGMAVVAQGRYLSYAGLNSRANKLARHLRRLGVDREVVVGVHAERSIEMIVGILAVVKAGGAYVPLDPAYPMERLAFMVSDSRARILLTQRHLKPSLTELESKVPGIAVELLDNDTEDELVENADTHVSPDNLCYIIYTSGSTGVPKGVQVTHRGLCNLVLSQREVYGITPEDKVLQFFSFGFDGATSEIFLALANGASLVIPTKEQLLSGSRLIELIQSEHVTVSKFAPSVLQTLPSADLPSLRAIGSAGEACTRDLVARWAHGRKFFNGYGPTETTIGAAMMECSTDAREKPPIGRPLSNVRMYILDENHQPVSIGTKGELYIGGNGVARGYAYRPDLTAERFLPNPFAQVPGERIYKTGDLARYLPDGNIEFLGRADQQLKIRGFRIEPEEIEHALASHPRVQQAVVAAQDEKYGSQRLIGYVKIRDGEEASSNELLEFLKDKLPDYMIPAHLIFLDAFPLTPNGKIDRKALPATHPARKAPYGEYVPPATPTQRALASIWVELLGVDRVGIYDDFFELGGHSLLIIRLLTLCKQQMSVDIPVGQLFTTPTVAGIADYIDNRQLQQPGVIQTIPKAPDGVPLHLSFNQLLLWGIDKSGSPHNTPLAVRLSGQLDPALVEQSITEIVREHNILRSTIAMQGGRPVHVIHPPAPVSLPLLDLQSLPLEQRETEALKKIIESANTRIDLATGPLANFYLLQLAETEHILFGSIHHLIFDGWSIGVFLQEFLRLYNAFLQGNPSPAQELPFQFTDYAYWQHTRDVNDNQQRSLEYWRSFLSNNLPILDLPTDRPRPARMDVEGECESFTITPELSSRLEKLGARNGATRFMALLAIYQILLQKYSGQDDLIVATPVANRTHADSHNLIGFFAGFLPLRANLNGDPSFSELLQRVRTSCLDGFSNMDAPFGQLTNYLSHFHDPGRMPVAQAYFTLNDFHAPVPLTGNLRVTPFRFQNSFYSGFDLVLSVEQEGDALTGMFVYHSSIFDRERIQRMAGHFLNLLTSAVTHPEKHVSELSMLSEAEREQLLVEWNDTHIADLSTVPVHHLIEEQAARTPDDVAILHKAKEVSYRELNDRANNLARHLVLLGAGAEQPIAVCMERSVESIVSMLGIFKAGAVYLPLNPASPTQRNTAIMADAGAAILLTSTTLAETLPLQAKHVICVNTLERADATLRNPDLRLSPNNAAYIIYTSGSTGVPKGVVVEHRSFLNLVVSFIRSYKPTKNDRVLQLTSTSFDASLAEVFPILCVGGTIVLSATEKHLDVKLLAEEIRRERISIMGAVPSVLGKLQEYAKDLSTLRVVLSGGEALLPHSIHELPDTITIANGYGPTETTVCCLYHTFCVAEHKASSFARVPIGRPIINTRAYVLDKFLQPVPVGVPGELYIGGIGVARGYVRCPDLTAERFMPDPFSPMQGARMYRTGDLVQHLPGGTIEFLGRLDHQRKLRGFRIELEEIEATLGQHSQVRDAVALIHEDKQGNQQLVAYYTSANGETLPVQEIRKFLLQSLPHYMIPECFVHLEALPLTSTGKLDRTSLPQPELSRTSLPTPYVAARNESETTLVAIWSDVLKTENIGVLDDFFALVCHSLLAISLLARVNNAFGVELPLQSLFEAPTIALLEERIRSFKTNAVPAHSSNLLPSLLTLKPNTNALPIICIHPIGGQIHHYKAFADTAGRTRGISGIRSRALLDPTQEYATVDKMATSYAELISSEYTGPLVLVGHSTGGMLALATAHVLEQRGRPVSHVGLFDSYLLEENEFQLDGVFWEQLLDGLKEIAREELGPLADSVDEIIQRAQSASANILSVPIERRIEHVSQLLAGLNIQHETIMAALNNQAKLYNHHYHMLRNFRPAEIQAPLFIGWAEDTLRGVSGLSRTRWETYSHSPAVEHTFEANHYSLMRQPVVQLLSDAFLRTLETI